MITPLSSPAAAMRARYDVVVIGSGYGGAIAASRLARAGQKVCVLERGEERQPGTYPNSALGMLENIQFDSAQVRGGSPGALFDIRYNKDINVVVGCGLGGTSLINAGICLRPEATVFAADAWPTDLRNEAVLSPYFDRAEQMLKPSIAPDTYLNLPKTVALGKAAQHLNAQAIPARVLVNFQALPNDTNHVGVTQLPCVGCGDCVTGCNFQAKNTLIMNYLPDAKNHSAEMFTQARVRYVQHTDSGWDISGESFAGTAFTVSARIVILAAGTLGSTEILLRSRELGLPLSNQVGNRFSGNGDTIGFAYNTEHTINGIGLGERGLGHHTPIGPCSTAIVPLRDSADGSALMIADGALPGAVSKFIPALMAVEARLVGADTRRGLWRAIKERYRELESEVFGVYTGATRNTMFFLFIAHDDSRGRIFLQDDRVRIDWPGLGSQGQFARASEIMNQCTQALGGTYIENPVWNELTDHNMMTGHPLGGCPMADSAERGVVNHQGQVFSSEHGDAVHAGLYVMDGSVIPTSLGVNPLLTISAVAERSCYALAQDYGWSIDYQLPSGNSAR